MVKEWLIAGLVFLATVLLAVSISNNSLTNFTELYLTDYPSNIQKELEFSFVVHNLEGKERDYLAIITAEVYDLDNKKIVQLGKEKFTLKNKQKRTVEHKETINQNFDKIKIEINLGKEIVHFWVYPYKKDCLPIITSSTGDLIINARGDFAKSWPETEVYIDNKLVEKGTVSSSEFEDYKIDYPLGPGEHTIEILFINDYTGKEGDRNLYLDYIQLGETTFKNEAVLDKGENFFDCKDTKKGNELYSNGAFRFRVNLLEN